MFNLSVSLYTEVGPYRWQTHTLNVLDRVWIRDEEFSYSLFFYWISKLDGGDRCCDRGLYCIIHMHITCCWGYRPWSHGSRLILILRGDTLPGRALWLALITHMLSKMSTTFQKNKSEQKLWGTYPSFEESRTSKKIFLTLSPLSSPPSHHWTPHRQGD